MKLKDDSVRVQGIRPELVVALMITSQVHIEHGREFVITSITDGKHSTTSLHYCGCAFDCRVYGLYDKDVRDEIKARLNNDYDVILEDNHIHIEFQPRYK